MWNFIHHKAKEKEENSRSHLASLFKAPAASLPLARSENNNNNNNTTNKKEKRKEEGEKGRKIKKLLGISASSGISDFLRLVWIL